MLYKNEFYVPVYYEIDKNCSLYLISKKFPTLIRVEDSILLTKSDIFEIRFPGFPYLADFCIKKGTPKFKNINSCKAYIACMNLLYL